MKSQTTHAEEAIATDRVTDGGLEVLADAIALTDERISRWFLKAEAVEQPTGRHIPTHETIKGDIQFKTGPDQHITTDTFVDLEGVV